METAVKQTLVRVDKTAINHTKEAIKNRVDLLNKFIDLSETTVKTKFTDKEKTSLKDEGINFVKQWLKPKFKFSDADEAFNLQALGIDLKEIQNYWNKNRKRWIGLNVEMHNGKFAINNLDDLPEVKRHYYYAKNERQEKALKEAMEVCNALNELLDKGLITGIPKDLCNGFKNIRYGTETNIQDSKLPIKFFPNEIGILKQ